MDDDDVTFAPEEAELRNDEKVCLVCMYAHFFRIDCPNCAAKTIQEYKELAGLK
jgi:hypothetical protein